MAHRNSRRVTTGAFFLLAFIFFSPFYSIAQNKASLTGKVIDGQTKQPIHAATVLLLHKDSTVAAEVMSRPDGSFTLNGLPEAVSKLQISVVGYQPFSQTIPGGHRTAGVPVSMGVIQLKAMPVQMQTVTVVGNRSLLKTEIDKK